MRVPLRQATGERRRVTSHERDHTGRTGGEWVERYSLLQATRTPPAARRPPSAVHRVSRQPSAVRRPPSAVHRPPSTVHRPPSTVHRPPSTVRRPSSAVRRVSRHDNQSVLLLPQATLTVDRQTCVSTAADL